ncbi:MAG: DNA primase [Defluviitaleaceae bacterium]|nr:DNA primase [Defluviitaleaceae bacterium]
MYPQEIISDVRALNDILDVVSTYVQMQPRSGNHFGRCPFHQEKTPSFSVNQDKQIFYCFGCGAGGNVLNFVMRIENMDFLTALKFLADRVNFTLPDKKNNPSAVRQAAQRELSAELNKKAALFYYEYLHSENDDAMDTRDYLEARGVDAKLIKRFGLGLSPPEWDGLIKHIPDANPADLVRAGLATESKKKPGQYYDRFRERLMFPIIDNRGRVVGFGGRILKTSGEKEAKYLNTPETNLFFKSKQLYGINIARKAKSPEIIIVEGYMDVLALNKAGFANTVGVLGTALTESHVMLLKQINCKTAVLVLDSDAAGIKAALRAIPLLVAGGLKVKVLDVSANDSGAKDPDEFLQKHGRLAFTKVLAEAKNHITFQLWLEKNNHDLSTTEGRIDFTTEAAKIIATLSSDIETDAHVKEIAQATDISPAAIQGEINKLKGTSSKEINLPRNLPLLRKTEDRGLRDAKKGLLSLVLADSHAAKALNKSGFIAPDEMGGHVYEKLLTLAFENAENNIKPAPADIISYFEEAEEQQQVAEVFFTSQQYSDVEKALNDMAQIVKKALIKSKMMQLTDLEAIKHMQIQEKSLLQQYISMSDG